MTEDEKQFFSDMYEKYSKSVYGVCLMYLKNKDDAEEAVSESYIRLMENMPHFESDAHAKAYLTRTAVNVCKNLLKSGWRKNIVQNEDVLMYIAAPEEKGVMEEILSLPPKYRVILYMHYYIGYSTREIAEIMDLSQSAVLSRLSRGRNKLRNLLEDGGFYYAR